MSEFQETGVSNNPFFREISNRLDDIPGFKDSSFRANLHGDYHMFMGNLKSSVGNREGASAEFNRAREQYEKARNGSPGVYGD